MLSFQSYSKLTVLHRPASRPVGDVSPASLEAGLWVVTSACRGRGWMQSENLDLDPLHRIRCSRFDLCHCRCLSLKLLLSPRDSSAHRILVHLHKLAYELSEQGTVDYNSPLPAFDFTKLLLRYAYLFLRSVWQQKLLPVSCSQENTVTSLVLSMRSPFPLQSASLATRNKTNRQQMVA